MECARHLEIVRAEGARVAALPPDALGAPVPTMEGWTVERVVRHLAKVHRWVTATLALDDPAGPPADTRALAQVPKGPACLAAYAESLDELLAAFERVGADAPAPSFIGRAVDAAWWARRQAHEVTVHRIDAQDAVAAAGGPGPDPIAPDGAADGVDEWARVFLATRWGQRHGDLPEDLHGRTVHLHGTDDPPPADGAEWLLAFGPDGVAVTTEHAKGDVALRGPAESLLLVVWRRRPLDALDAFGDVALAQRLLDLARF
jgi:uncharacterized protein (TIGR03083 family)